MGRKTKYPLQPSLSTEITPPSQDRVTQLPLWMPRGMQRGEDLASFNLNLSTNQMVQEVTQPVHEVNLCLHLVLRLSMSEAMPVLPV
jgi:hypothetical protein